MSANCIGVILLLGIIFIGAPLAGVFCAFVINRRFED